MILETARITWAQLRAEQTGADTALTAWDYGDWPASNTFKFSDANNFLDKANGVFIAFHGSNAADEASDYKIYGRSRMRGPIQLLFEGVLTLGTQNATTDPITGDTITNGEWVDTITVDGGIFSDSSLHKVLDSGVNRIAMLKFDRSHIADMYVEFDVMTSAASMAAIITGY